MDELKLSSIRDFGSTRRRGRFDGEASGFDSIRINPNDKYEIYDFYKRHTNEFIITTSLIYMCIRIDKERNKEENTEEYTNRDYSRYTNSDLRSYIRKSWYDFKRDNILIGCDGYPQ
jgi:hypothetical protein